MAPLCLSGIISTALNIIDIFAVNTTMVLVGEILPSGREGPNWAALPLSSLLMTWLLQGPCHQQTRYWPSHPRIFWLISRGMKGTFVGTFRTL